jgi:hypothetical protein
MISDRHLNGANHEESSTKSDLRSFCMRPMWPTRRATSCYCVTLPRLSDPFRVQGCPRARPLFRLTEPRKLSDGLTW